VVHINQVTPHPQHLLLTLGVSVQIHCTIWVFITGHSGHLSTGKHNEYWPY